ncbi:MAG: NusG domain II-containing protein [Spirochaetaceae bacterium]
MWIRTIFQALDSTVRKWPGDLAAAATAVAVLVVLFVAVYAREPGTATHVTVQAAEGEHLYSLEESRTVTFDGPIGETIVRIDDGEVWVEKDPGPLQICVKKGRISRPDEWLACLPNEVFIRIAGSRSEDGPDAEAF